MMDLSGYYTGQEATTSSINLLTNSLPLSLCMILSKPINGNTHFSRALVISLADFCAKGNAKVNFDQWSTIGSVQLVSGRPCHPQSQGLVEQAHYTLERMLSVKIAKCGSKSPPWIRWLPHIVCKFQTIC